MQENVVDTYGWETVLRKIFRCEGGFNKSTMAGYVNYGDDKTYLFNFRMTHVQLEHVSDKIDKVGFLKDIMHSAHSLRLSGRFKFATSSNFVVPIKHKDEQSVWGVSTLCLKIEKKKLMAK